MTIHRTLALSLIVVSSMAWESSQVKAQDSNSNPSNLTSSPYTRYGFGKLGTVGNASTRGMGDVGIALRTNQYTNLFNPASLTAIDTLTMLFDTAVDADWFTMSENGTRESDWNAGFGYLSFHFPLWNRFAGAISYMPYSTVGYEYGTETKKAVDNTLISNDTLATTKRHVGNGGLQHFQLSMAWNPIKTRASRLDLGVTAGYICGSVEHDVVTSISSGHGNTTYNVNGFSCIGWDLTVGAQYTQQIRSGKSLVYGVTYSPRTHIGCDVDAVEKSGTDSRTKNKRLNLSAPSKYGAGISYQLDRKLTIAADYGFERWSDVVGLSEELMASETTYQDISHLSLGIEYRPKLYDQNYFHTCQYRAGISIKDSYVKKYDSMKEYSASCGIGMPVGLGKRSTFNFSVAYSYVKPKDSSLLKENYLSLTVGITFNEMMFYRSRLR